MAYLERRAVHMEPRTWLLPHVMSVHRASLARRFRMCHRERSRAVSACHERPPRQSRSQAVSACHERPPRQSRSQAVSACHERPPRQCRSRAVSACHETSVHRASLARGRFPHVTRVESTAPVSLAGGCRMSRASPAPVSLAGGFRMSRASTAPVSLAGGFRMSRASTAPVSLAGGFRVSRASSQPHTAVPPASLVRPICTPSRHRTPGLQHNEMEIPSYLRRHSLYRSQAP